MRAWASLLIVAAIATTAREALAPAQEAAPPSNASTQAQPLANAIALGADWLVRHQDPSGHWDPVRFDARCRAKTCDGAGSGANAAGITGLAVLALLGADANADEGHGIAAAERGLQWFLKIQNPLNGSIGGIADQYVMYNHVFATLALLEGYSRNADEDAKHAIQRALEFLLAARNPKSAWRYSIKPDGDNDSSITSSVEIVFASAVLRGFPVDVAAIDDGVAYLDGLTDEQGRTGYQQRGGLPARLEKLREKFPADKSEALTAVALDARLALDAKRPPSATIARGALLLHATPPVWDDAGGSTDFYYWYHATNALHGFGGIAWKDWREAATKELLAHQRADGEPRGSFDPIDAWGTEGGRVYATAINLLTLETLAME